MTPSFGSLLKEKNLADRRRKRPLREHRIRDAVWKRSTPDQEIEVSTRGQLWNPALTFTRLAIGTLQDEQASIPGSGPWIYGPALKWKRTPADEVEIRKP